MKFIFLIVVSGYALVCLFAYLIQARFIYFPERDFLGTPEDMGLKYRDVTFRSARGTRLHGWYVPVPGARNTVLYCHGNAGNISHRLESIRHWVDRGVSVFMFDYSGYGRSEGRPSEGATYADARGAWDWLLDEAGVPRDSIILLGRSLGTAVAVDLAVDVEPRALILESPFTSAVELGGRAYWWLPVRYLIRNRYDSTKRIGYIDCPKIFVHSLEDEVIPYGMGKRLYNRAPRPKTWVRTSGPHNQAYLMPGSRYEEEVNELLEALNAPRGGVTRL